MWNQKRKPMQDFSLKLGACSALLVTLCASPVSAADITATAGEPAPYVVIPREVFIESVLAPFDTCARTVSNLDQQIDALKKRIDANIEEIRVEGEKADNLLAQLDEEREKERVITADRDRLKNEQARTEWWSNLKDYGLVILGTAAVIGILL